MKPSLAPDLKSVRRFDVTVDQTIDFMGEDLRVFATTFMLARIEQTCRDLVLSHLDEGEDSVGARVEIDHLGPTLAGMWIEVNARVLSLDGQRVELAADICDALGQVGRARHTRFVIDKTRQRERLSARRAKAEAAGAL
ncbi:MAG: LysR family transcriptional regulator [Alphaproteobacteria bacterium]|nr:LysR family transcriptional regulator [Alphaproteobacteria bacterium]